MPRQLTSRSRLDNLKLEAKRWLKALRAGDESARARLNRVVPISPAAPTLRQVQHALAVEHGFAGWSTLKTTLANLSTDSATSTQSTALHRYEALAANLLEAYRAGSPDALQRLAVHLGRSISWDRLRQNIQLQLGKLPDENDPTADISRDDARLFLARSHGFETWDGLAESLAALPETTESFSPTPIRVVEIDKTGAERPAGSARDWDTIIAMLKEARAAGLNAEVQMTDALLERISHLDHITSLNLDGSCKVTDAGLQYLRRMPQLRYLRLHGCSITDRGLEVLRALPNLATCSLQWCGAISDEGMSHLSGCDHLERLDLLGTSCGDGALRAMAGKRHLKHLKTGSGVTDAGLPLLHDIPAFKTWQDGAIRMGLTDFEADPTYLLLRGPFTDQGMSALIGLDGLFGLNLDNSDLIITHESLIPLRELPNLGWLGFDAVDAAMPNIAALPKLRFLMCQDTVAGDAGFKALSRSRSLEYLWGRRCHNLGASGFKAMAAIPTLQALSVSCKNVDDPGIAALPRFPALRELMPMDVPDAGYRHIRRCEHLESLVLMYCRETTDLSTEHLAGMPSLKSYFASYNRITDRSMRILAELPALKKVGLTACAGVSNAGLAELARSRSLREVDLGGLTRVTEEGTKVFAERVRVEYSVS